MALSMTGFGRGSYTDRLFAIRVEIRSVNHRFLDISARLPRNLVQFEDRLRRFVGERLNRGKIEIVVQFKALEPGVSKVNVDNGLAAGYRDALLELAMRFDLSPRLRLDHFTLLPDLFIVEPADLDSEALWPTVSQALADALGELTAMRQTEGAKLADDLLHRVEGIADLIATIEAHAPLVPATYRSQLQRRLEEALGSPPLDEARLVQEIAIYADRCSITEELVRLRSHLSQLEATLHIQGALGRKADFILQEINREINTIGAKANDLTIAQVVIEVKTELEKIREQIQNLE